MFKINPYRPGAGVKPQYLAGRDEDIENVTNMFTALTLNIPTQSVIFSGLRGVGKTVLINRLQEIAEEKNIFCKHIEVAERNDFISQIATCSQAFLRQISVKEKFKNLIKKPLDAIKSLVVSFDPNDNTFSLSLEEKDLDGIIAIGKFSEKEINLMNEYSSNIVFLDSSPDDEKYDSVKINFKMGVFSALDYLYNLGHTRIGYIGDGNTLGDNKLREKDVRLKYYNEYMKEKDILNEDYIINCDMTASAGYTAMIEFIKKGNLPTHVFINSREDLEHDSIIMCEQIRTIDKSKLIRYLDRLDEYEMEEVEEALSVSLGCFDDSLSINVLTIQFILRI